MAWLCSLSPIPRVCPVPHSRAAHHQRREAAVAPAADAAAAEDSPAVFLEVLKQHALDHLVDDLKAAGVSAWRFCACVRLH